MINLTNIDNLRAEIDALNQAYQELYGLMFTNDRNLSDAGRGLVAELKRRGMRQKDAVRILGISSAGAYQNWHAV